MDFKGHPYRRCGQCSLVFLEPGETRGEDTASYTKDYIQKRGCDLLDSNLAKAKKATAAHYLSLIERFTAKGNLLDVGCSTGIALKAAQERGWEVHGVEVNAHAASLARKYLNTETVKVGYLNDAMFPDGFFSAIVMFDVIEHVPDPVGFLEILTRKLKRSGILFILTPDIASASAALLKERWPHFFLDHVCLYSRTSIRALLERCRLRAVKAGWAVKFITLDIVRRHLECHPGIFMSKAALAFLRTMRAADNIIFPFNIGEMYAVAQKE